MIPAKGWKPLSQAPTDGTTILLRSREWNNPSAAFQVQPGQWLCDMKGKNWGWYLPARQGAKIFAEDWMTFEDFRSAQLAEGFSENLFPENYVVKVKAAPPPPPAPAPAAPRELVREMFPEPEEDEFAHFQSSPPVDFDL